METERNKLYDYLQGKYAVLPSSNLPTRKEFDEKLEKQKAYTLDRLATRRCPMTLEGAARVAGGYGPVGDADGRVPWRFRIVIDELVQEGKLVETHKPNGNDTYHIPGGKWDPVIISAADADLIAGIETNDPQLQELQRRLEVEAAGRFDNAD